VTQRNPLVTTGADVLALVLIGGALLAAGFLILGARRRRSASGA
jgi:LPXTG-motif cell wall-anchored protein